MAVSIFDRFPRPPCADLLGWTLLDADGGTARIAFEGRPEFCNPAGFIQGGMLAAMLDLVMAFAVLCTLEDGHVVPSLEMKTSFIAPARAGEITGDGTLVRKGRSIAFMEGRLIAPQGKLLATASATGQIRPRPAPIP